MEMKTSPKIEWKIDNVHWPTEMNETNEMNEKRENVSMFYGWIWQQRKYLAPLTNFNFNLPTKWRTNIQWSMLSPRSFVSLTALPFIGWLNGRSIGRDQSEMNSIKDQKKKWQKFNRNIQRVARLKIIQNWTQRWPEIDHKVTEKWT